LLDELYTRLVACLRPSTGVGEARGQPIDPLALIIIEPMASYRFMRETFGRTPDAIDDERFVAAWVDVAMAVAQRHGLA
jgi:hypothetical protein